MHEPLHTHLGQHLVELLRVELEVAVLLLLVRLAVLEADLVDEHHLLEVVLVVEVRDVLLVQLLLDVLHLAPHDLVHVADGEGGEGHLRDGDGVGVDGDHQRAGEPPREGHGDEGDPRDPRAHHEDQPVGLLEAVRLLKQVPCSRAQIRSNLARILDSDLSSYPLYIQGSAIRGQGGAGCMNAAGQARQKHKKSNHKNKIHSTWDPPFS